MSREMIINLFDSRVLGRAGGTVVFPNEWSLSRSSAHGPGPIVSSSTEPAANIMRRVRAVAGTGRTIWMLRILCHGNSAFLQLGNGISSANANVFSTLNGYFTPDGPGVSVHACLVASSVRGAPSLGGTKPGIRFLQSIAGATGAMVRASTRLQYGDSFEFNGRLAIVRPDGRYGVVQPPDMRISDSDRRYFDWSTFSTDRPDNEQWFIGP